MSAHHDRFLEPIRMMLELVSDEAAERVADLLHAQLNSPATAAEMRVDELGLLATLLDERPQEPGELPYVPRDYYDQRRAEQPDASPRSAALVENYGSWARACWGAWGLLADGRDPFAHRPWNLQVRRRASEPYTVAECVEAVHARASALGRRPSSREYHEWQLVRCRRERSHGLQPRLPKYDVVVKSLAPCEPPGLAWRAVVRIALGDRP